MTEEEYYVGVDVGTGSVRAGLVTRAGHVKVRHVTRVVLLTRDHPVQHVAVGEISRRSPAPGHYVQSSTEVNNHSPSYSGVITPPLARCGARWWPRCGRW